MKWTRMLKHFSKWLFIKMYRKELSDVKRAIVAVSGLNNTAIDIHNTDYINGLNQGYARGLEHGLMIIINLRDKLK